MFYHGEISYYEKGSSNCYPLDMNSQPVTWNFHNVPFSRRYEIVSSGTDPLVGISKTKFGSKALQLNHRYGIYGPGCKYSHDAEINKIVKRFRVTQENQEFAVWFAVVTENPSGHNNSQPFFSISCDLAPDYNLCFDASYLNCETNYSDPVCQFDPIDVLDWTCHKIRISNSHIGQIATLEISAADCGCKAHFGYAYVDGICEDCDVSAFGNGKLYNHPIDANGLGFNYKSCNGDTVKVCGDYTLPNLCGLWVLDHIEVPDFIVYNLSIDTSTKHFCFDIPKSNLNSSSCKELHVKLFFKFANHFLPPVHTNTIILCPDDFKKFENTIVVGSCQNNNTNTLLSDDYYYVRLDLANYDNDSWTMERQLDAPYPNELGKYTIATGSGGGTINLGPIMIQEGGWTLTIKVKYCTYSYHINPPNFCSGCSAFNELKITNITCNNQGTSDPADDTWSFSIFTTGTGAYSASVINGNTTNCSFGGNCNISGGLIIDGCIRINLTSAITSCNNQTTSLFICPPKPCSSGSCNLEVYRKDLYCNTNNQYQFTLLTLGNGSNYCARATDISGNIIYNGVLPNNPIGPFNLDLFYTIFLCSSSSCPCSTSTCYKSIYIPFPDCNNLDFREGSSEKNNNISDVKIIPNPVVNNEFIISSNLDFTDFVIYNLDCDLIYKSKFSGRISRQSLNLSSGLYILSYKDNNGKFHFIKFIKQ